MQCCKCANPGVPPGTAESERDVLAVYAAKQYENSFAQLT
jgi:hypothetical protein